ncbi:MAG: hypothetical protein ACXAC7_16380 [Candidatus Hodarchaeales archaeon]|jgi:hypothetical protein
MTSSRRFPSLDQIIIRCSESRGYEVKNSTIQDIDESLIPILIPRSSSDIDRAYFYKTGVSGNKILIKLVIGDGKDQYNRPISKSHCLIVSEYDYYDFGGLMYFASPLWLDKIPLNSDLIFDPKDFFVTASLPKGSTDLAAHLLQAVLSFEHLILVCLDDPLHIKELQLLLAYVDLCIPPQFTKQISLKGYLDYNQLLLANVGIILDDSDLTDNKKVKNLKIFDVRNNFDEIFQFGPISPLIEEITQSTFIEYPRRLNIGTLLKTPHQALKDPRIELQFYSNFAKRFGLKLQFYEKFTHFFKRKLKKRE